MYVTSSRGHNIQHQVKLHIAHVDANSESRREKASK